jgi:phosphoribosylformimino-5-aminoimidazole carboxamide ribotide isomerase
LILYPAIDIQGGRAVRLVQGRFEDETVYRDDPLDAARDWVAAGARALHIVDLDGAREGQPRSLQHLERITAQISVPVQYGGGLRSIEAVEAALDAGAGRVILGTAAFRDMDLLDEAVSRFATRLIVSVDVRGGNVSTAGWTETTQLPAVEAIVRLQDRGVRGFVYTDADRDGMLDGPDLDDVRRISDAVRGRFIYSGGIGSADDLRALSALRLVNLAGAISGKALYERKFTLEEGQAALVGR